MKAAANILKSKPDPTVYTIAPNASVFDAVKLMPEKSIGALVVTKGEQVVGIIAERDYARKSHPYGTVVERNSRARHHDLVNGCSAA